MGEHCSRFRGETAVLDACNCSGQRSTLAARVSLANRSLIFAKIDAGKKRTNHRPELLQIAPIPKAMKEAMELGLY
jgi:hypothetical protein